MAHEIVRRLVNGIWRTVDIEAESGGGGSQPQSAVYSGNNVSVAFGVSDKLDWGNFDSGDDLLDITDPLNPAVRADGTYLVSVWVKSFPLTAGGYFTVDLILDPNTGTAEIQADSPPDNDGQGRNVCCSAGTFIAAGDTINVYVSNQDGVATRTFSLKNATIVKVG